MPDDIYKIICLALSLPWKPEGKQEIIPLITNLSDWPKLFLESLREKVCGSFYYLCKEHGIIEFFPNKYKEKFKNEYFSIKGHNIFQLDQLENIIKIFDKNNIPVLIIKGYSLLKNIYPTLGSKYPGDIDLVVKPTDLETIKNTLRTSGYSSFSLYPNVLEKKGFLPIDLKTDLISAERIRSRAFISPLELIDMFSRSLPWNNITQYVKIPSWEDHILLLCAHAEKHSYSKISLFYDICQILYKKSKQIDLEKLRTKSFNTNTNKPLYVCLHYIQTNFFYKGTPKLIDTLKKTSHFTKIEQKIITHILSGKKLHITGSLLPVFAINGFGKKIRFIWELIFPSKEILHQVTGIKNPNLTWLMYPTRLFQLTGELFKALPKLLR